MPDISKYEAIIQDLENGRYATLGVSVGSQTVTLGTKIAKQDTGKTPAISAPPTTTFQQDSLYTIISLDIDAPFKAWNVLSPIVHWIQTDLRISDDEARKLESTDLPVIPWLPAGPPPGAAPHRYIFLLYRQNPESVIPKDLKENGAKVSRPQRMRYDVDKIVRTLGLGEVVAVNYFVSN
ncbi:phosphatidylethanolamine-binding protein [Aspergillus crustosus]